jgi:hypothetical protein
MSRYDPAEIRDICTQLEAEVPDTYAAFKALLAIADSPAFDRRRYTMLHDRLVAELVKAKRVKPGGTVGLMAQISRAVKQAPAS